jgi:integrase/recombinase XerD
MGILTRKNRKMSKKAILAAKKVAGRGVILEKSLIEVQNEYGKLAAAPISLETTLEGLVSGQLSVNSRKAYGQDARQFLGWLAQHELTLSTLTQSDLAQYRRHLSDHFAPTSAARKLVVARRLLEEAVERGLISHNPAQRLKGIETQQETTHTALTKNQARQLLEAVDTATLQGKRDYALLLLLLKTGIRRGECASLKMGDLEEEQGHNVAVLRHTKGNKRRKVKLAVEVRRAIEDYVTAARLQERGNEAPLFVQFRRGDHPQGEEGVSDQLIQRVVEKYTEKAKLEVKLTPHGLRATFVTLALEGGAKLQQVQYAVGHADPRTTERYQKRKLNLDDAATDYVKF